MKIQTISRSQRYGYESGVAQLWYAKGLHEQSQGNWEAAEACFARADQLERQYQLQTTRLAQAA
ncbi:MAG: hypothetical protein K1Y36_08840 [Blastocatellia bacterium]|nr:hypothetical protein [Blastocatellia bacterium]